MGTKKTLSAEVRGEGFSAGEPDEETTERKASKKNTSKKVAKKKASAKKTAKRASTKKTAKKASTKKTAKKASTKKAATEGAAPARRPAAKRSNGKARIRVAVDDVPALSDDERRRRIAEAAYYRAEARGFAPGGEVGDWIAAEAEVDARTSPRA